MPPQKSRNWCFTLNNYSEDDFKKIDEFHKANPAFYVIYGKEKGENETPHLQGYVHYLTPQAASRLKKVLPRSHIEKCKGDPASNITYCKKEGDWTEYGIPPVTQQESNKEKQRRFIALAKAGDFATIEEEMPGKFISQYRTMKLLQKDYMHKPADLEKPCGIWIYGESGVGKTHYARTKYGEYYTKSANKWWDGYQGEETVVLEDLDPNHKCLGHHLKLWLDKWSFPAEEKGGMRCLRPTRVVVTSQYSIEQVFEDKETIDAIKRRCAIIHLHERLQDK